MILVSQFNCMKSFKIALLGATNSGKTSFINCLLAKPFDDKYHPSSNINRYAIDLTTNVGVFQLQVFDLPGNMQQSIIPKVDAVIVFHHETGFEETLECVKQFKKVCPYAYMIDVWSKADQYSELQLCQYVQKLKRKVNYKSHQICVISSKNNHNCRQPIQRLLQLFTYDDDLLVS